MSNMVTIKNGDFYYVVPMHEFSRYWVPNMDLIEIERLPKDVPRVSMLAALKRGKGKKRFIKSQEQKGSGKHDPNPHRD